jgi:hypothetical protein
LKQAALIEKPQRGISRITDRGQAVLVEQPDRIDMSVLEGFPDDAPPDGQASVYVPARAALAAAFAALVTHTMMYAAFLEDPSTWVILAVGLALAAQGEQVSVPEAVSRHAGEPAPAVA